MCDLLGNEDINNSILTVVTKFRKLDYLFAAVHEMVSHISQQPKKILTK